MSHYAKLATLAFRVVSIVLAFYAILGFLLAAKFASSMGVAGMTSPGFLFVPLGGLVIATLLYVSAPFLGRFAASGLGTPERID
jgi:hypothetical protein